MSVYNVFQSPKVSKAKAVNKLIGITTDAVLHNSKAEIIFQNVSSENMSKICPSPEQYMSTLFMKAEIRYAN